MNTRRGFLAGAAVAPLLAAMGLCAQAGESVARLPGARPFALSSVRLLPGPFEAARALDARYLLSLSADRLLHGFHTNAGLAPKAPRYGGWESGELCPGHTLGHYLSACSASPAPPRLVPTAHGAAERPSTGRQHRAGPLCRA